MDLNSFSRLAEMEHEQRMRSLTSAPKYDYAALEPRRQRRKLLAIRQLRPVIAAVVSLLINR